MTQKTELPEKTDVPETTNAARADQPGTCGTVADAPPDNWVDRWAPAATRPYLRLSRADRPIGTWLLLLPCWWGLALAAAADAPRWGDLWIAIGCTIGAVLMRGAGCTWNDITDRDFDGRVARTRSRPIPSGQVTVRGALIWMAAQVAVSALILLTFPPAAIVLGLVALIPVAIYPFAKRFTWWPQVFLGIAFNWGALLAWAAHTGSLSVAPVLLYLSGLVWTLFYDTIYAHQDKEDDALIGIRSTARLFADQTGRWLNGFLIGSVALMTGAVLAALLPQTPPHSLVLALIAPWAFGWHMIWQLRQLDIDDPGACLRLFRSNRDTGLIVALFLAAAALV
ncbi:4-hydroxybenzoate octaprenyltransferase [Phaeovulum sp. NW3]|uniref:4-hydroxybenzoate octaprenyltransferase n=1 Tax=Phaeovulum sp. NW3 TaxID=2934933 RepID=UPI00202273F2|nr:4-hydroxybenzoate octaprenyltransferase [Phaeovulum sp. NW3]MCL7463835.1 4-hydroxybenzoate octaprenyltransferase [Phaeovulum sp. NW3]